MIIRLGNCKCISVIFIGIGNDYLKLNIIGDIELVKIENVLLNKLGDIECGSELFFTKKTKYLSVQFSRIF